MYEMLNQKMKAIEIASNANDVNMKAYDQLYEENDCIYIVEEMNIQLLNDNIILWKQEMNENE